MNYKSLVEFYLDRNQKLNSLCAVSPEWFLSISLGRNPRTSEILKITVILEGMVREGSLIKGQTLSKKHCYLRKNSLFRFLENESCI